MAGRTVVIDVGGVSLLVETTPVAGTEQTSSMLDKSAGAVAQAFDRAQAAIVAVAESTVGTIGRLGERSVHPDELTVTFGLKFSAQGHVIVAGAAGEATLEVALTYRREPEDASIPVDTSVPNDTAVPGDKTVPDGHKADSSPGPAGAGEGDGGDD